jgi:hypothetical protein
MSGLTAVETGTFLRTVSNVSGFQVSSDDLIALAVNLARRWGALRIPEGKIVRVANFKFRRGVPAGQPGVVSIELLPGGGPGIFRLDGNSFEPGGLSIEETLGIFIDWVQGEIEART